MPHADRPYPLAGVDQALGEGSARPPAELLDQLRERLRRLDPNHPSASPRSYERSEAPDGDVAPGQDVIADQPASQEPAPRENVRAGEPPAVGQGEQPTPAAVDRAAVDRAAGGPAADGQYRVLDAGRVIDTGRAARGEAYRPWFAGEPGPPWFADPDLTE